MTKPSQSTEIPERALLIFKSLVERYIADGHPVGSRILARDTGLDLSPATIRNVMADLEDLGLILSPHTSAGRIPTVKGYRFFVDTLLTLKDPTAQEMRRIVDELDAESDPKILLHRTSDLLSELTHFAGVVMVPRTQHKSLRHIEFVALDEKRVLVILVFNDGEVQNRVINTAHQYSASELEQASNYLNSAFVGRELADVKADLLAEMEDTKKEMNLSMQAVIEISEKMLVNQSEGDDYVLAGETNLMGVNELSNLEKLRQLFEAFTEKRGILHLLDHALNGQGIQIFIGEESGYKVLDDCSVVTSTYSVDGQALGVLGIIGPTRMAYERVIPVVDITAKMLSAALKSLH